MKSIKPIMMVVLMAVLSLSMVLFPETVAAHTEHSGAIVADETWAQGTHYISDNVTVGAGVTLTISAGAVVKFAPDTRLIVNGTLDVNGKYLKTVIFTSRDDNSCGEIITGSDSSPAPGDWQGIVLAGAGNNQGIGKFDWCRIRYGGGSPYANIEFDQSDTGHFINSISEYSELDGLRISQCVNSINITDSTFNDNKQHGIYLISSSGHTMSNNDEFRNSNAGICLDSSSNNMMIANNMGGNLNYGMQLISSSNNVIYLNNFTYNFTNVNSQGSTNAWNSPTKLAYMYKGVSYVNFMGNRWSDYVGSDVNNDGLGDVPYNISNDQDSYPLMFPFISGDANWDGKVNIFDLVKVKRIILGIDASTTGADDNLDGQVNVIDLIRIKRIILKQPEILQLLPSSIINEFPNQKTSKLVVIVRDGLGFGMFGQQVNLSATFGTLSTNQVITDANGSANFTISSDAIGGGTVTAKANDLTGAAYVTWAVPGPQPEPKPKPEPETEEKTESEPETQPEPESPVVEQPGTIEYLTVDFAGKITKEPISGTGRLINDMESMDPDGAHLLEIDEDTMVTDEHGNVIKLIEIREAEVPPLPANTVVVGKAYDFSPSNISFDQLIRLTLSYDVKELPGDVISVAVAYYTAETGWNKLQSESNVVAEVGKVTAAFNHFTIFAVLAEYNPPPVFKLSNLSIEPSVSKITELLTFVKRTGKEVTVTVNLANDGGNGTYDAVLKIDGVLRDTQKISLNSGQNQKITLTAADNEPGRHEVQIGSLSGEFVTEVSINWWLIIGSAAVLSLIGWLAWRFGIKALLNPGGDRE